jgi:hypothetical protein
MGVTDKTIKLWKVYEKQLKVVMSTNVGSADTVTSVAQLRLPKLQNHDKVYAHVPRRVYANAHAYHINAISINSDGETFISADDLRINLWNLGISDQSFSRWRGSDDDGGAGHSRVGRDDGACRHSRHQAAQHGGAHRGDHGRRLSPIALPPVCV